ncbi:ABC transporter substrate-binding protein [Marinobacter vinifirmus]|uniref:ABC transporter substrate-binding protein n=1 Tax=Marinobacter vinifirmus TaxID=355591 RepID=A0A7Z1DX07_9GAMM|nr:ABC transporter substrate-binding protein [Marinobacter vinifirmus]OZC37564.1 ABC transporter substrate-binding protein [Marinobacter vinifirmus]
MRSQLAGILLAVAMVWPGVCAAADIRLVTADGAITEIVYRLGLESLLVGVDTTSGFPEAIAALPKVGYLRALPFEGVLALQPDMLITSEQAAPQKNLERLSKAGVQVEILPSAWSSEASLHRVQTVGGLLGKEAEARALVADLQARIDTLHRSAEARGYRPKVLFVLAAGNHSVMLAGKNTAAEALLDEVNADIAFADLEGYKPASREAILASQPDAIVIAESVPGQFNIDNWPELQLLDAWKSGHRLQADSMLLLGFGPRLVDAMAAVNEVLPGRQGVANR